MSAHPPLHTDRPHQVAFVLSPHHPCDNPALFLRLLKLKLESIELETSLHSIPIDPSSSPSTSSSPSSSSSSSSFHSLGSSLFALVVQAPFHLLEREAEKEGFGKPLDGLEPTHTYLTVEEFEVCLSAHLLCAFSRFFWLTF